MGRRIAATLLLLGIVAISVSFSAETEDGLTVYRRVEVKNHSLHLELLIDNPTKAKLEQSIQLLVRKYGKRKRLQIDIFDDLEALQRRGDETYPTKLVYSHWLVSITNEKINHFYLKERPEME